MSSRDTRFMRPTSSCRQFKATEQLPSNMGPEGGAFFVILYSRILRNRGHYWK